MALGYQGLNGNGNTLPEFYNNVAELGAIISGAASASFAGMKLLDVAVKSESWAQNSVSIGAIFDSYGEGNTASGVPVMQLVMFLVETFWTISSMSQVAEIALAPFVVAYLMQTHYTSLGNSVNEEMNTVYLSWSFLIAFGSFLGAWALSESANIMVGYYDVTGSAEFQSYLKAKKGGFDIGITRTMFFGDLIHHMAMLLSYGALAAGVQAAAFGYVYFSITGQEIDLSILDL